MVGIAISVAIGCLDLDKRKGLMSSLESRNDMVRCDRWQRYKFILVNVTWTMFHDAINVDVIMSRGTRSSSFSPSTPMPSSPCIITFAFLSAQSVQQSANPQGAKD
jgi:hypothetical protein